jgi:putative phage-type endonuclease
VNAIECSTREGWLEARKKLITASDAAAALGLSPWKSPLKLYTEKIGLAADQDESESMKWGRSLQEGIGRRFAELTGREVTPAPEFTIFTHPDAPFVGCTLDFYQDRKREDGSLERGILETKATSHEWQDEPPLYNQVQAQIQMACVSVSLGTLTAFQGLRKPPAWADIELNPTFLKRAISKLEEFQWRVSNRKPPEVRNDGSDSTAEALKLLYPRETVPTVGLPPEALQWSTELASLKAQAKELGEQVKSRESQIKAAIGDAEIGLLVDGSAWRWRVEPRSGYSVGPSEPRVLRYMKAK